MLRAAEEVAGLGSQQLQHYLLRYNRQQLDGLLIDAMAAALRETGVDLGERLRELRREEHCLSRCPANLLDFYYCSGGLQPQEVMWAMPGEAAGRFKENHFYKGYWSESRFAFVGAAGRAVRLRLTCRLPGPARGRLVLALNGRPQAEIEIGGAWETWDVVAPGEAVREGVNEVTIRWPLPELPGQRALEAVCADPDAVSFSELFPCFGEIHSFTAAEGCPAPPQAS